MAWVGKRRRKGQKELSRKGRNFRWGQGSWDILGYLGMGSLEMRDLGIGDLEMRKKQEVLRWESLGWEILG